MTTGIDNICNNLQDDIISGNVLLTLTDHFAQIISVNREQIDWKKINVYQRDYWKFEASVDRHAPLKKLTAREIKIKNKPW